VGPDAQLVLSSLITKDVFSSVILTQIGSIPHSELTGSHTGPRKQRHFRFTFHSAALKVLLPSCWPFQTVNMELDMHSEDRLPRTDCLLEWHRDKKSHYNAFQLKFLPSLKLP